MPTPSTRTPVRIARGSYSNLNGSVSDLQDGEISYAEDQDKLYIKEGASLVALTYTPASPAFTGTITGVNLTLSGNLTVNGTQTIINTQTLDVEDKQIEIGKVSSPSDTTADQGGWKLKGATDKTFLWVNATHAWTSSEHIHLPDSKHLKLGTSLDLQLFHDASNSWLKESGTGILFVDTDGSEVRISSDTNSKIMASFVKDGACQLRHNNDLKFATSATGVTVTGTVSDSKGDVRKIIQNHQGSAYELLATDSGKHILASGNVTWVDSRHAAGDAVTIVNNTTGNISIIKGTTMYNAADGNNANRVLAARGMATILWASPTVAYISGAGLS